MASVGRVGQALLRAQRAQKCSAFVVPSRTKIFINKDWQPGPYPETEAERRAAAKKYNMVYEDYQPYDKENVTHKEYPCGDYPKLEPFGEWSRDPHANYELRSYKRNYGEPMHLQYDSYTATREDVSARGVPRWQQFLSLFGFVGTCYGLVYLCDVYEIHANFSEVPTRQQFPHRGVTHYTFEPAD